MKDIGILTYDFSENYGALLQAWALSNKCLSYGYIPHIIKWAPFYHYNTLETGNMKLFRKKYLPLTALCYTENELNEQIKSYSKIIIGGDQVFRNCWGDTPECPILRYYGDFVYGKKTLASYAASFGIDTFDSNPFLIKEVKSLINRFDKISVREKSGVNILKTTFDAESVEVLDPVFLLKQEDYEKLINKIKTKAIPQDYIAYMVLDNELGLGKIPNEIREKFAQSGLLLNINSNDKGKYNKVEEWLNYIKNAKFVITDSFHCIAFCIIFQKPFVVVKRDLGGNSRIENILANFNLQHCQKTSLDDVTIEDLNIQINWKEVYSILDVKKKESENFLKDILELEPKEKEPFVHDENLINIRKKYEETYYQNLYKVQNGQMNKIKKIFSEIFSVKNEYSNNKKRKVIKILGAKIKIKTKTKKELKMNSIKKFTTVHYLIALLQKYNITNVVASPGTQNACFNLLVQENENFSVHSVVDERSAAYVAVGISDELQKPVVITCTGATASRNYMSALTESYYRNVPVIALTFFNYDNNRYNLGAQFVDRSVSQNDIKELSVELPILNTEKDKTRLMVLLNKALTTAIYKRCPVHINCPSPFTFEEIKNNPELPVDIWTTQIYDENNIEQVTDELKNKNVAVFIGSHAKFNKTQEDILSDFAVSMDIPVFCDHTSGYNGKNKVLVSQAAFLDLEKPEIVIDIGNVTGEYAIPILISSANIWRVSHFEGLKCRHNIPVTKLFNCSEEMFFEKAKINCQNGYYSYLKPKLNAYKLPEVPLSMHLVCREFVKNAPNNITLHLAILNALRAMNFLNLDSSVETTCNVGGFGIDGAISTVVGHSIANPNKKHFCITGDLAFFYDMNILGNRDIKNNLRIIVVNNNRGEEFHLNPPLEQSFGDKTDKFVAAAGHYKNGAKLWAQSCEFEYLCASSKEEFVAQIDDFCNKDYNKPVLFEVFTNNEDEKNAQYLMFSYNKGC